MDRCNRLAASCKYSKLLRWNGLGTIRPEEREKLRAYVKAAHAKGRKVRLWASPESPAVWNELLACGVDLINTNQLAELRDFLLAAKTRYAKAGD